MRLHKVILGRPKLPIDVHCNKCNNSDLAAVPIVQHKCKSCGNSQVSELQVNIYAAQAKSIITGLANHNMIQVVGVRSMNNIISPEHNLEPKTKHEHDIYQTMLYIKNDFDKHGCWEVSEIVSTIDEDYKIRCLDCGINTDTVTCCNCHEIYIPKVVKGTGGSKIRHTCPKCRSKVFKPTYVKNIKNVKNELFKNYRNTILSSENKTCPKCKSKNITKPRKIPVYSMVIKRQVRNWNKDLDEDHEYEKLINNG